MPRFLWVTVKRPEAGSLSSCKTHFAAALSASVTDWPIAWSRLIRRKRGAIRQVCWGNVNAGGGHKPDPNRF